MTRRRYPSDSKPRKPGGAGPGTAQVTAIIPTALKARLDVYAKSNQVSVAAVIREALEDLLDRLQITTEEAQDQVSGLAEKAPVARDSALVYLGQAGDDAPASATDCGASGR